MSLYLKTSKETSAVGTHRVKNGGEEWPLEFIGCEGVSLEVFNAVQLWGLFTFRTTSVLAACGEQKQGKRPREGRMNKG